MSSFINPNARKNAFGEYPTVDVPDGWPNAGLEARLNDTLGQAILDYAKKWGAHPDFPASPWDDRTGEISLIPPDQKRPDTDPMPVYRLREAAFLGCNLFIARDEAKFCGWSKQPHTLEAMNDSAERVLSYQRRYGAGRTLPGMPWIAGVLNLPNPALLSGTPDPFSHRGAIIAGGTAA